MFILSAIGNRACGAAGWHAVGLGLLTIGLWLGHPLWSLPLFAGCTAVFRSPSTRPWLHMAQPDKIDWILAMERTILILPLIALETYFSYWHVLKVLLIPGIPTIYWLAGKQKRTEPIALAEFVTGGFL